MFSVSQRNMLNAYVFLIISLIFGLPLLTSYYVIQFLPNYTTDFLVPYMLVSVIIGLLLLQSKKTLHSDIKPEEFEAFNRLSAVPASNDRFLYMSLSAATISIASFGAMKYFISSAYPATSSDANISGVFYLVSIVIATLLGFPTLLARVFPILRTSLKTRALGISYYKIAVMLGTLYFFTYLLLVNQIVITGYNTTPGNFVSPPNGIYPQSLVFTSGPPPSATAESLAYVPYILVQINQYFNLIIQPFEMVFAIILSTLVAATFILTMYLIRSTNGHSCVTGATVSGLGGFLGLTATCPSCLAPTLISVFFGGLSSVVQSSYSSLSGVILPPVVSIISLLAALIFLNYRTRKMHRDLKKPLET